MLMNKNILFSIIGLTLGLVFGFKAANFNYRRDLTAMTGASAQATSQMPKAGNVTAGNSGELTAEQSQQLMNQASAIIQKARANPGDLDAQHQAAEQFMQIRRPEGALEFLINANRIKPDDPGTMADLAEAYFFSQKFDQALNWSRRALNERPNFPPAMFFLMASLVETRQNLAEAEELLAQLEAIKPGDPALAQVRQHLQAAKQEATKTKDRSVLSHGPEANGGKP